jgi:hypothetical protein
LLIALFSEINASQQLIFQDGMQGSHLRWNFTFFLMEMSSDAKDMSLALLQQHSSTLAVEFVLLGQAQSSPGINDLAKWCHHAQTKLCQQILNNFSSPSSRMAAL